MESTTPEKATYAGVDVSKDRLDYALPDQRWGHVPNTASGHAQLLELLRGHPAVRVICESTGGYERAMIAALLQAGVEVCLVQPARVRAFAHAEGLLAKTDRIDAALLRRFGEADAAAPARAGESGRGHPARAARASSWLELGLPRKSGHQIRRLWCHG
jgi:transposase